MMHSAGLIAECLVTIGNEIGRIETDCISKTSCGYCDGNSDASDLYVLLAIAMNYPYYYGR